MNTRTTTLRVAALSGMTAVICAMTAPAAVAADGDVEVLNTETVQVYTSPTGEVETQRVYEQLVLTGTGSVDLSNPISTEGLRNLDGFSGFDVRDGNQVTEVTVDGEEHLRSVSDFDGELPLDVSVAYTLDGESVEPGDVVGESGKLEVIYTVKNVTGQPQEVSFPDGQGGTMTKTVDVPLPMVGSLSTVAPENFTNVESKQANMAGDGKGGTKMSFTMTLFPPIGSDTATFGYTADIVDGVVPRADVSALPVNPLQSPTFATAAESYGSGADTGAELADGAATIDSNLLKLRDGAAELLAGLIKLRDGSAELRAGLAGEAAPGAAKLADGAGQLDDGLTQIDDGAGRLADGTGELLAGTGKLDDGANRLADGLTEAGNKAPALLDGLDQLRAGLVQVDRGLAKLYGKVGAIEDNPKYQELLLGLDKLQAAVGNKDDLNSLTGGVNLLRTKFEAAVPKVQQMADGVYKESLEAPGAYQKLGCAITVLTAVKTGTLPPGPGAAGDTNPCFRSTTNPTGTIPPLLALAAVNPADGLTPDEYRTLTVSSVIDGLTDGRDKLATADGAMNETTLYGGLLTLLDDLTRVPDAPGELPGAIPALTKIECVLDNSSLGPVCEAIHQNPDGTPAPGLRQGLLAVDEGVQTLVATIITTVQAGVGQASDTPEDETLRGGMSGLIDGTDQLTAGGDQLLAGLGLLSDGAGQLADGTGRLSAGAGELNDGAGQLADGTGQAVDGSGQLADGAGRLADGLQDAADGSGRLTDGLGTASDGAPKLVDGAEKLSVKGTSKLVEAGVDTAQTYGELGAVMVAGAERAEAEDMAYGAPEGALGLTAYSYVIQGEDGESTRNWARGLAGLALLGLGGGAFALRRRVI